VFTFSGKIKVNKNRARDYRKDFVHRLWASDVRDEAFIERFYEGEEVEDSLKSADTFGPARYEEELEHLVNQAVKHYELYWLARPGRGQGGDIQQGAIKPKKLRAHKRNGIAGAWERQEALARYVARAASEDEKIISFRKDVLSGRVLSEEEALTFLASPLAADTNSSNRLKTLRINPRDRILDSNYRIEEGQDDWGLYRKLVWGHRRSSTVRPLGTAAGNLIFPGDAVTSDDLRTLRVQGGRAFVFPHPREANRSVVAKPGSVIEDVGRLAEDRLQGYPISLEMGVWFILTGEFVSEDPVRIRYMTIRKPELMTRTTITLEVESWLPPEEVLKQYRHAQHEVLGKTPRSLKRDALTVFEFVNQRKGRSWRELFEAWNEEHPPHQRFKDRSHLYTTYTRAVENVAGVEPAKTRKTARKKRLKVAGTDSHGFPIYAGKWYLLHPPGHFSGAIYTGTFESREEAQADPRSENSEVLAAKELVTRLAERGLALEENRQQNS
jgi:hypothetical protein